MRFLKGLFWVLLTVAIVAVAVYLTAQFAFSERLTNLYLEVQPWLPVTLAFDQFLVVMTVASVLLVLLILAGALGIIAKLIAARQAEAGALFATKRDMARALEHHRQQYEQLRTMAQGLAKQLDKRVLAQGIIEAASRLTSVPQANAVASLWLLHFETDSLRFDCGFYCDETMFKRTQVQPADSPFAQALATLQPQVERDGSQAMALVQPDKQGQLGAVKASILVPMVIEDSVLGYLLLFCHPDAIARYESDREFYAALWTELALALAIAIQGEVAILDRLTGAHNREYFMKRLIQELERATRYGVPVTLLMIDIDHFKAVNDRLGHPQGDAVLKIISKLIKKSVRAIDLVGRYGGEEFVVMLPETGYGEQGSSASGGAQVAERIRRTVDEEFQGLQKPLNLTVSVGVVCRRFPEDKDQDYRELIRLADEQLYKAKTSGRNKVSIRTPDHSAEVSG
jgi:diguanylate cyclase (GGDEF)-like protein